MSNVATYRVYIDLTGDGDFVDANENISAYVMSLTWELGMNPFESMARVGGARIMLNNTDKRFSPNNTSSPYYDATTKTSILPFRAVKITMDTGSGETDMFRGLINRLEVLPGTKQERTARLHCFDNMTLCMQRRIQDFGLQTDMLSSDALEYLLDSNIIFGNWLLGIAGKSELGTTTILGGPRFSDLSLVQTGLETFQYIGDRWFTERTIIGKAIQDITQSEGFPARCFFGRDGRPVFWNRNYLKTRTDTPTTINADSSAIALDYNWGDRVYNWIIVQMTPREVATDTEVIFINRNRPLKISFGGRKEIRAQFVDEVGARVGAQGLVTPAIGTDYTINTEEDGTGTNITSGLTVSLNEKPEHAIIIFQSNISGTVYIRGPGNSETFQLRGRKLKHFDPNEISARDGESESLYGTRDLSIGAPLLNDADVGQDIANLMLKIRGKPRDSVTGLTIVNKDTTHLGYIESVGIGDLITLSESQTLINEDYVIVGEQHVVHSGGTYHEVTYRLEPFSVYAFWLLGTVGRAELGETTYLG